jgi:hypothetical protein
MRKIAAIAAAVGALVAIGADQPANAAMGQCFDGYGRPMGGPYNTDNPPYGMICSAYRRGGSCTGVQADWAANNCGVAPRYRYRDGYRDDYPRYRRRPYDY